MLGKYAARATPMFALAALRLSSACLMSGRLARSSEGKFVGTVTSFGNVRGKLSLLKAAIASGDLPRL